MRTIQQIMNTLYPLFRTANIDNIINIKMLMQAAN